MHDAVVRLYGPLMIGWLFFLVSAGDLRKLSFLTEMHMPPSLCFKLILRHL